MESATKVVAVTGATGFLGSNLVRALLVRGYQVRALARDPDKARALPAEVKTLIGDICDVDVLKSLVEGCDWVFHTVSNFRTASGPPESYEAINVEGTRRLLEAANAAGVSRVVHVSTIGVHGDVKQSPADETSSFNPGDLYQETKLKAEKLAVQAGKSGEMEVAVIRPCSMYGPGDLRMLKMFKMISKGTFFKVGPCRESFHAVYIDDVIERALKAATTPDMAKRSLTLPMSLTSTHNTMPPSACSSSVASKKALFAPGSSSLQNY